MTIPIQPLASAPPAPPRAKAAPDAPDAPEKAVVDKAIELVLEDPAGAFDTLQSALAAINPSATPFRLDAFDGLASIRQAFEKGGTGAAKLAFDIERAREASRVLDPTDKFTLLGKIGLAITPFSALSGANKSVAQFGLASEALREWARTGSAEDGERALGTVAKFSNTVIGTGLSSAETYVTGKKLYVSYEAAKSAFTAVAPNADPRIAKSAAWASAKHLLETGGRPTAEVLNALRDRAASLGLSTELVDQSLRGASTASVDQAVRAAVDVKKEKLGLSVADSMGAESRAAARETLDAAARAAGKATIEAGATAATGTIARSLARFAPGVNIGLAVLDSGIMYATLCDSKASTTRKVTSVITSAGAWVSATNIPVVSQVGALVSMVSAFTGAFF